MIKRAIILPDVHIDEKVSPIYKIVKKLIKDIKIDEIILLGDFADIASLSAWDYDKKRPMEGRRYKKEMTTLNNELDFLQKYSKKITYLEGNHEFRIERYLDKNPEMEGLIELKEQLSLDKRRIKFIKFNKLYKLGKCRFTHGMYTGKYHATKHLQALGCSIVYGHGHRAQSDMMCMKMQDPIMAYGLGCLCDKQPDYLKNRPSNWINQFAIYEWSDKTGDFNIYPVNIINKQFRWNNKTYSLLSK